jgi:hypothetical protein
MPAPLRCVALDRGARRPVAIIDTALRPKHSDRWTSPRSLRGRTLGRSQSDCRRATPIDRRRWYRCPTGSWPHARRVHQAGLRVEVVAGAPGRYPLRAHSCAAFDHASGGASHDAGLRRRERTDVHRVTIAAALSDAGVLTSIRGTPAGTHESPMTVDGDRERSSLPFAAPRQARLPPGCGEAGRPAPSWRTAPHHLPSFVADGRAAVAAAAATLPANSCSTRSRSPAPMAKPRSASCATSGRLPDRAASIGTIGVFVGSGTEFGDEAGLTRRVDRAQR